MIRTTVWKQNNTQRNKKKNRILLYCCTLEMYPSPGISIWDVKQDWYKTKDESIDDTGEWFIVPVSSRWLRSTVILRLHEPADVGPVKGIQALPSNLKTRRIV